jgi:hypothetical protein
MADFTQKAIKDVIPGDMIIAFDELIANDPPIWKESRHRFCVATVEKTFEREVDEDIYVDTNGYGFTGEHPFLTQSDIPLYFGKLEQIINDNQDVFSLKVNDTVNDPVFSRSLDVSSQTSSFTKVPYKGKVYNLKTSTHTYISGEYLLHNCLGGCYSEHSCFKRTTHICEITKIIAQAAEKYWKVYDQLEGTDHFQMRTA